MGIVNSVSEFNDKMDALEKGWETFKYWINPVNLFAELHRAMDMLINHQNTATGLMAVTIVAIWLIMLDVKWVKKYLFWSWVVYWVLRGFVYPNEVMG